MNCFIEPLDPTQATFAANDIFDRKDFGVRLMKILEVRHNHELVVAIDAPWGDGKTVFVHQWKDLLVKNNFHVAYYDAFAHDYHSEPLIPFVGEIYKLFGACQNDDKKLFKTFASELLNAATLKVLPDTINLLIERHFSSVSELQNSMNQFGALIKKLRPKTDNAQLPIVFIIDELDRCKPSYAIKLLEVIKHLFAVPGIAFVLSVNSDQLRESIKHEYGREIDAGVYLNKFIDIWATLPKAKHDNNNNKKGDSSNEKNDNHTYVKYCTEELTIDSNLLEIFCTLSNVFELSYREIEKCLTYIVLFQDEIKNDDKFIVTGGLYAIILKVKFPDLFYLVARKEISYEKLISSEFYSMLTSKSDVVLDNIDNTARIFTATNVGKATSKAKKDVVTEKNINKINDNYKSINDMFILLSNFDFNNDKQHSSP